MKQYIVEPKYKKSFIQLETFIKKEEDGTTHYLEYRDCFRWGGGALAVPETREEIEDFKKHIGYEGASDEDVMEDYGAETWEDIALPDEGDEIMLFEDFGWNAEMIECWDGGCYTEWSMNSYGPSAYTDEECEEQAEALSEVYYDEYEEGLEALGWEQNYGDYIIGEVQVRPVKEGQSIYEAYDEKD